MEHILVAFACVSGSAKNASVEKAGVAERLRVASFSISRWLCALVVLPTGFRRWLDPRVACSIAVPIASTCDR
jgi:hypothetical protein